MKRNNIPVFDEKGNKIGTSDISIDERFEQITATIDADKIPDCLKKQQTLSKGYVVKDSGDI